MAELDRLADQAAGDGEALRELVTAIQGDVWRFCAHLSHPADADDLTQETLTRMIAGLRRWDGDAVMPWVLGIARNVCFEHLRRRHQRRTDPYAEPETPAVADRTGLVDVVQLLAGLPFDQREAIVLTQVVGLCYVEAAEVIGCPLGTVRSRVARGRDALAAALWTSDRRRRRHG